MPARFTHRFKDLPQNTDGCFLSVMLISVWEKNIQKPFCVWRICERVGRRPQIRPYFDGLASG